MDVKITPSSGNVFTDLGFDEDEAEHLRIRSTLMIEVRRLIEARSSLKLQPPSYSASPNPGSATSCAEGLISSVSIP